MQAGRPRVKGVSRRRKRSFWSPWPEHECIRHSGGFRLAIGSAKPALAARKIRRRDTGLIVQVGGNDRAAVVVGLTKADMCIVVGGGAAPEGVCVEMARSFLLEGEADSLSEVVGHELCRPAETAQYEDRLPCQ